MATTKIQPQLTLIGAGPGDAELITLKGLRALKTANVVLYDALVSKELLDYAPIDTIKMYVGKRASKHEYSQDEINKLIVQYAFAYGHVARLKGGDPFVFGRGHEELQYAETFGIPTTYIPGISSSIGVAGLQGIPVTHRGISESFWVITGTTSSGKLSEDVYQAARTEATAVILMGVNKLSDIVEAYLWAGKKDLPVAIIQNGSLPNERLALGTIETIVDVAQDKHVGAPAIIVIGKVVNLHPENKLAETIQQQVARFNY